MSTPLLWQKKLLPGIDPIYEQYGPLRIWLKCDGDELQMAHEYVDEAISSDEANPPVGEAWQRWTLKRGIKDFQLLPILPDLPLVVRPESSFKLLPGVRTNIYVRIPIWISGILGGHTLFELPTIRLSKTWFGDFYNGEVCYWLLSSARKEIKPDSTPDYLAISPIEVVNRSAQVLQMDKLCHRVRKLSLYHNGTELWSNKTTVNYQGDNKISEIEFTNKPPAQAGSNKALSRARDQVGKSFTAKTFNSILEIAKLDLFSR